MNPKKSINRIEWEFLLEPIVIRNITDTTYIKPHPEEILIERNTDYGISLKMTGNNGRLGGGPPARPELKLGQSFRGERLEGWVKCKSVTEGKVIIEEAHQRGHTIQGDGVFESRGYTFSVIYDPLAFYKDNVEDYEAPSVKKVVEYCVSGPNFEIMEAVSVRKNYKTSAKIEWNIPGSDNPDFWKYERVGENEGAGWAGIFFKTKMGEFLISSLAKDFVFDRHSPVSIHYLDAVSAQDDSYRKKVTDLLSIIFGRNIFSLGVSYFDLNSNLVLAQSKRFFSANLKKELNDVSKPFWFFTSMDYKHDAPYSQETANQLFDLLSDAYDTYNLHDVFIDYWLARSYPLGVDLVWYANALEGLVNKWFRINKDKFSASYVNVNEFNDVIGKSIASIEDNEKDNENWSKIKNSIKRSNSLGSRDKQLEFFKHLGIEIDKVEIKAMQSRNRYAHGGSYFSEDIYQISRLSSAYQTLFHRALLAVVGYEGKYIDYSAYGFPPKDLSESLGGPQNNKEPFEPKQ